MDVICRCESVARSIGPIGPIGPISLGQKADRRRSPRQLSLLTHSDAQRSIRPWVVKSGRKWVQPRSNTDHQQHFSFGPPTNALSSGQNLCCEETTRRELM